MEIIRERVRVTGRVQGVGFRYTARMIAKGYGVVGFVENEYDGSVLMELQGTEKQITDMMIDLSHARYIRIDRWDAVRIPVKEERSFRVKY